MEHQLRRDIQAAVALWLDNWNYEREKTIKCDRFAPDGRTDMKVEIVMNVIENRSNSGIWII